LTTKVHIFYHYLSASGLKVSLEDIIAQLPDYMRNRALRYKSKQTALNFIQGRLLLSHGIGHLGLDAEVSSLSYADSGKPYLPHLAFNISHSHHLAVCAFSSAGAIGIDVESKTEKHLPHLKHNFTDQEWDVIQQDPNHPDLFYQLWCRKESIIKATGKTLSFLHQIQLNSFANHCQVEGQTWHLRDLDLLDNYFGSICTQQTPASIDLTSCTLDILEGAS